MAKKSATEFLQPNWDKSPPQITIGNCLIEITHDLDQTPSRAISVLAHPVHGHKDSGSFILYYPGGGNKVPYIGISDTAYWSNRRKGPASRYFSREGHPKLTLSVLQALDSGDRRDRTRALLYLFITPSGYTPLPGEGVSPLINDPKGFKKVADKWIAARSQSIEGLKEISSARKLVEDAKRYNKSLKSYEALVNKNVSMANLKQSAILLAVSGAARNVEGIPLLCDVRSNYHTIVAKHQKENSPTIKNGDILEKPLKNKVELHLDGFDTAVNKLGFSWLPRSWPSQ